MTRYDYKELRTNAINNPTFENLATLANWLTAFDPASWNGEFFDINDGLRLRPIIGEETENGIFPIINFEIF